MEDDEANYEIENLKTSKQMANDAWVYTIQRMDLLIITISGAGVYIVLETLKYSYENKLGHIEILKLSGVLFVLGMIVNFISQSTGKNANLHHIHFTNAKLKAGKKPTHEQQSEINGHDHKADVWSKYTTILNTTSMILMFLALISIVSYFLFIL